MNSYIFVSKQYSKPLIDLSVFTQCFLSINPFTKIKQKSSKLGKDLVLAATVYQASSVAGECWELKSTHLTRLKNTDLEEHISYY